MMIEMTDREREALANLTKFITSGGIDRLGEFLERSDRFLERVCAFDTENATEGDMRHAIRNWQSDAARFLKEAKGGE